MQSEISALIHGGFIDNRVRGRVTASIRFLGIEESLDLDLQGNCFRDLAGCLLEFACDPDPSPISVSPPSGLETGMAGEITASRRLLLPGPFSDETNCLYLEWFQSEGIRQVLLKPRIRCTLSPPQWQMTELEELEQKKQRWALLRSKRPGEVPGWFEMAGVLGIAPPSLNETEWDALLEEAEEDVERLIQFFDRADADAEWAGPLSRSFGWPASDRRMKPARGKSHKRIALPPQPSLNRLNTEASTVLEFVGAQFPADTKPDFDSRKLISSIAQVSAILETARESVAQLEDGDQTLLIALVKRALAVIHAALEQLSGMDPNLWLNEETSRKLSDRLFSLREHALDTMANLRSPG